MNGKVLTLLGTVAAMATLAAPAMAQDKLVIGAAVALTGNLAYADVPAMAGMQLAVEEINAAGGVGGRMIEIRQKDSRSDPAQAAVAAQELIDEGISVLVTPCDADPTIGAGQIAQAAGVAAFSTCASSPTLPMAVGDHMFLNFPGDNVQSAVSAKYATDQGYKTAAILVSPDTAYTQLPLYFKEVFEKLGGKVVAEDSFTMGQQDFSAQVTKIKALSPAPDVIMTAAYEPDFPAFIKQLRASGVKIPVIGSDGIDSPTTFAVGEAVEGVVFTTAGFAAEGSPLAAFNAAYKAKYGQDSDTIYNAIGYDLVKVVAAASKAAGSAEPAAVWQAVRGLQDVQGATGAITYKGTDGVPIRQVAIVRIQGGKRALVLQATPDPALVPKPRM
ncbi:branched-chain amino acid transport system substrate-binding protein [Inquilinus ginsengisoli]|uniref:Branched-chain amino acid transport system substrate-binding protein n=1 Tax=Inquilinus ginsengisoli TaxID=363840 RepID=A0ABU1JLS7_9PROT|nr:ABC transporter substrate-binding protein [Inquilinus ginsengisoli]MDR6289571.1 branched-chain amino acid transport system substrate-binding protein [Inquilinus ginsengisoli]